MDVDVVKNGKYLLAMLTCLIVCIAAGKNDCHAAFYWEKNGIPVCDESHDQCRPLLIRSAEGQAIVAWEDARAAMGYQIYVQKVHASGTLEWQQDGVYIDWSGDWTSLKPQIASDGHAGGVMTWALGFAIDAKRITSTGLVQWSQWRWTEIGSYENALQPKIINAGSEKTIIAWHDKRNGQYDLFAQKTDIDGNTEWNHAGNTICAQEDVQSNMEMVADDAGGAILVWEDSRAADIDIFAQRVDGNGVLIWTYSGLTICAAEKDQTLPKSVPDGENGAIVVWEDERGNDKDLFAQRIDHAGNMSWSHNGVTVCAQSGVQESVAMVNDGTGGAIVVWADRRHTYTGIYAQRINADGSMAWEPNGMPVCVANHECLSPTIVGDRAGGAIVAWEDYRDLQWDIYAQKINADGSVGWEQDGVAVCDEAGRQQKVQMINDDDGFAVAVWQDDRKGNDDIYAQKIYFIDPTPTATPEWIDTLGYEVLAFPNPAKDSVSFALQGPEVDGVVIEIYNMLGVRVAQITQNHPGLAIVWNTVDVAPGVYLCRTIVTDDGKEKELAIHKVAIVK